MTKLRRVSHAIVEFIPESLEEGKLYVSIRFATAVHKCCCGCGLEVTTPISTTDWRLIYDGETVSLDPSIGNWGFPCQSHYWIVRNKVIWARRWSHNEIEIWRKVGQFGKERSIGRRRRRKKGSEKLLNPENNMEMEG